MSVNSFESAFRIKEENFLQFKHDFGHPYQRQRYHLLEFDRFCRDNYPTAEVLSEEIVMKWATIKPTENSNGYISRITTIRQFGKYLSMLGEDAFILPDGLKGGNMPLMPYVFSEESLSDFFSFTDTMERSYRSPFMHLIAPVIFRYMYCCGLRPMEARNLMRKDIDFASGRVFISESKQNKERFVYAPEELLLLTESYLHKAAAVYPDSDYLFINRSGKALSRDNHQYLFELCRNGAGIGALGTKQPNLYSFRHTFATHRIYQWCKEGQNISANLPSLSAYMGHSHYAHTLYYLHLMPEIFADM